MNSRITGKYARRLLTYPDGAAPWIIEQRHLAETIVWLYGREPDTHHPDNGTWWDTHEYFISQGALGITLFDGSGESRTLNAEQAIDLARALLNAAERMDDPT